MCPPQLPPAPSASAAAPGLVPCEQRATSALQAVPGGLGRRVPRSKGKGLSKQCWRIPCLASPPCAAAWQAAGRPHSNIHVGSYRGSAARRPAHAGQAAARGGLEALGALRPNRPVGGLRTTMCCGALGVPYWASWPLQGFMVHGSGRPARTHATPGCTADWAPGGGRDERLYRTSCSTCAQALDAWVHDHGVWAAWFDKQKACKMSALAHCHPGRHGYGMYAQYIRLDRTAGCGAHSVSCPVAQYSWAVVASSLPRTRCLPNSHCCLSLRRVGK